MKCLFVSIMFALISSVMAFDLPSDVKKSIKKHCEGDVVGMEKESVKGLTVYAITTKEGKRRTNYFFSESGRLIHHARDDHDEDRDDHDEDRDDHDEDRDDHDEDDEGRDEDEGEDRFEDEGDHDEEDRLDRFEDEGDRDEDEDEDDEDEEEGDDEEDETYEHLEADKLPKEFLKKIKKHLGNKDFEIGREIFYIVETREDDREVVYIFSPKGTLLEKEFHDEEDEDEDEGDEEEGEDEDEGDEEEGDDEEDEDDEK